MGHIQKVLTVSQGRINKVFQFQKVDHRLQDGKGYQKVWDRSEVKLKATIIGLCVVNPA